MSKKISNFFIVLAMTAGAAGNAGAEVTTPPEGECVQYLSCCNYSGNGVSWGYSNTMIQNVAFENGKLFIENLCGSGWAVGEINEEGNYAVFQVPQQVDETYALYACTTDGEEEIELNEFYFDFTEDKDEITLRNSDGHRVILKSKQYGYDYDMYWSDVILTRWTEQPSTPPEDSEISYFTMDYVNVYGRSDNKVVEMTVQGQDIWMKNFIEFGYLKGEILDNGNIRFKMPQYMGLNGNFIQYTYGFTDGVESDYVDLVAQNDGGYALGEGMQLWGGEAVPEYCLVYSAVFTPVEVYTGLPMPPSNAEWSNDFAYCFDFDLIPEGANGENLPLDWLYWQVLVNDEPFTFTLKDYPSLVYSVGHDTDMLPASGSYYVILPSYEFLDWGRLAENKYRCYIPAVSAQDNVSVRVGYKVGDNPIQWSEAIAVVSDMTPNTLPATALYFTYASLDTEYGPYVDNGIAMYVDYGAETMKLSGFFERDGYVVGNFTDESRRKAVVAANQVIATSAEGLPITLVPAIATPVDPSAPYSALMFTPLDEFTLRISSGGENVAMEDAGVYLLEVTGSDITTAWCPGMKLTLVTEEVNEMPEDASVEAYEMTFRGIRRDEETTDVLLGFVGDDVWIEFNVNSNFFKDEDIYEHICLKGTRDNNRLVFELPQFIGVTGNYISYATADLLSFQPTELIFELDEEQGAYVSAQPLWIGTGEGYPIWLAAEEMSINLDTSAVNEVKATGSISFVDGSFVDSEGANVEVFSISGMKLDNRNLMPGTYIIVANSKTQKICVR